MSELFNGTMRLFADWRDTLFQFASEFGIWAVALLVFLFRIKEVFAFLRDVLKLMNERQKNQQRHDQQMAKIRNQIGDKKPH